MDVKIRPNQKKTKEMRQKYQIVFGSKEGKEVYIKNLLEYCIENKLVRGAMYDLMTGKRKSYKGYKFLRKEE
jgi:hypothetical protein